MPNSCTCKTGLSSASLLIVKTALSAPTFTGANIASKVIDSKGGTVNGNMALCENSELLLVIELTTAGRVSPPLHRFEHLLSGSAERSQVRKIDNKIMTTEVLQLAHIADERKICLTRQPGQPLPLLHPVSIVPVRANRMVSADVFNRNPRYQQRHTGINGQGRRQRQVPAEKVGQVVTIILDIEFRLADPQFGPGADRLTVERE